MSQDLLMNAVSRLENVATRLESLARSQPASRTSSSSAGDSEVAPFILAFDAILSGPFAQYVSLSSSIGGDVKTQSDMVQGAFQAERQFLLTASQFKQPVQSVLPDLLKPISEKVSAIQDFREKNRNSPFFNHLSTISECVPALGWVNVSPKPGPYVKELADSGMFYGNRVLKEFKEKDPQHVEWIRSWNKTLVELQAYIKQFHTTGTAWNPQGPPAAAPARGGAPPPPPPGPPPPPPPAAVDSSGGGAEQERAALFSQLNKGTDITKGLKKVSDDMKTHKNPALRQGPAPFKAAGPPKTAPKPEAKVAPAAVSRPPLTQLQDKKWIVEYHNNNKDIIIDQTETKQVVYVYKCVGSTITVKGKVNSILLDGCKKSAVVFEDVVSSVEFINCQSVQGQVTGKMPTVIIDKTDGCMMYLSKDSIQAEIVTAKSSELNILVPQADGEYKEFALPEQFKSTWNGSKFVTIATESV
ncbi:adenylyl cyclase-associated protein 1-like [Haliotis rufescens]|uniref:adenylyl cyclase-associated protein 1-like n=1 Tax=Haliotis rufescens TaxID=6454 RepID=UPI00201F8C25|nr:adenylyl cyclase-associated protein 1-like [Haliotis rufescens]XP_046362438.2 adenylyl cyclase-associated protein 1-like [Haliotis rufescens]XP_046362439.2 adenylyl cyclase-associated protein 1-like [Haliotis rufescens]XP_046362440.2 adenylyl cyclase-associated protein 1-like [Haliotis rufescens]